MNNEIKKIATELYEENKSFESIDTWEEIEVDDQSYDFHIYKECADSDLRVEVYPIIKTTDTQNLLLSYGSM